ncbi:MAG TPA: metallophosphoesterase [Fimbriimonadaceae bacterium]|nr:hypothetical protein [Armatimonadota bacterium]HRD31687.1 metallophosphoesterase [Fimbriimonadaceae bacterium]HRE93004.1 metallophosphoesterase [Fimbriimonadaceae bacterium]HRI74958.1 metallophosphoesterase [Fimbriimonadaceae bacterium]
MTSSPSALSNGSLRILHTNDLHGRLTEARAHALRSLREAADLYFDTGDLITAGNLAVPLQRDEAWAHLADLNCSASVIGNRETHVLRAVFSKKLEGHQHPVLCGNLVDKDGSDFLPRTLVLETESGRVGVVAVSVAMVTRRMKTAPLSHFLWDPPLETALRLAEELRPQVDHLFALTHIGLRQDRELAATGVFDVIFGGHSHDVLTTPEQVGRTWIAQGGSHARFVGVYEWDGETLAGGLQPWPH